MDQKFAFLGPKEMASKFLENKPKQNPKTTNKKPQTKQKITENWISISSPPVVLGDVW